MATVIIIASKETKTYIFPNKTTMFIRTDDFTLRYVPIYPGVNSQSGIVTLALARELYDPTAQQINNLLL